MTQTKAKIKEVFTSIQGEGAFIGVKQLFIRFCGCNLACNYCDTDFSFDNEFMEFTPDELFCYMDIFNLTNVHSVALTGGEPLIWTEFLKSFLCKIKIPIYLETNATLSDKIGDIFEYIDVVAADIKIPSVSGIENSFILHNRFFQALKKASLDCAIHKHFNCDNKTVFAKVVFDENIKDDEIDECIFLAEKYKMDLILQPLMKGNKLTMSSKQIQEIADRFLDSYKNVRLIPQTHKFLDIK